MKRYYKILTIMFIISNIFAAFGLCSNAAEAITINIDKTNITEGETVTATVELPGGNVCNGGEVIVTYPDDKLTYISTMTGDIYANAFINNLKENASKIVLTAAYTSDLETGGLLGSFTFEPAAGASGTATINVKVKSSNAAFENIDSEKSFNIGLPGSEAETTAPTEAEVTAAPTSRPSSGGSSGGGSGSTRPAATATPTPAPTTAPASETAAETTPVPAATPEAESDKVFTDIDGHWAEESILALYNKGYINGFDDNTFRPEDKVTRAQFVKMIADEKGIAPADGEQIFKDVPVDAWYAPYASAAYAAGIVNGDDDGNFNPSSEITRQEMAVMLMRAYSIEPDGSNEMSFADASSIADWAADAVAALSSNGIINGFDDNTFRPVGSATRAQAAAVLARFISE